MFALTQADLHPRYCEVLLKCRAEWDEHRAVAWVSGRGPWDGFVHRIEGINRHVSFFAQSDGSQRVADPNLGLHGTLFNLFNAIMNLADELLPRQSIDDSQCCIFLRPNAIIVLQANGNHIYIPLGTAHEAIADAAKLETDFPGIFQFAQ